MIVNIYELLKNDAVVADIVAQRIYLTAAPQYVDSPFVVWQLISNAPYNTLHCPPDSDSQRIQIDCYAVQQPQSQTLAEAVRDAVQSVYPIVSGPVPLDYQLRPDIYRWTMDCMAHHTRDS